MGLSIALSVGACAAVCAGWMGAGPEAGAPVGWRRASRIIRDGLCDFAKPLFDILQ